MRTRILLSLIVTGVLIGGPALAGTDAATTTPPALAQLKALAGTWQAKTPDGKVTRATYEVDAGGSAVVERLEGMGEAPMITVYYPDGAHVMLTHYCTAGNQPRMRTAGAASGKDLNFAFVDATNLKSPADGHMHALKFTFTDADHFSQVWTMRVAGKETPYTFNFERAK
jgi:hypothetical protein